MDEKYQDILKHGIHSQYWDSLANTLPYWSRESAETKLYIAGYVLGFPHTFIMDELGKQSQRHGSNFQNQGFFIWVEHFKNLKR